MGYKTYNRIIVGVHISYFITKLTTTREIELYDKYTGKKSGEVETIEDTVFKFNFGDFKELPLKDVEIKYSDNVESESFYENFTSEFNDPHMDTTYYTDRPNIGKCFKLMLVGDQITRKPGYCQCYVGVPFMDMVDGGDYKYMKKIPMEELKTAMEDLEEYILANFGLHVNAEVIYDIAPSY